MSRDDLSPSEYAIDVARGLLADWLSQGYPGIDHGCLENFPGGCPRCLRIRDEVIKLRHEMAKGDPAIKSLIGSGHVHATQARECLAMPGLREQSICTPQYVIDRILRVWAGIELDPCSNPESIVPARLNCILSPPDTQPRGGGSWLIRSGLDLPWPFFTYCNPPWGKLRLWLAHGVQFSEVIWLVPLRANRGWFQEWLGRLDGKLALDPVRFLGYAQPYPAPCMMGYQGLHVETFYQAFADVGSPL